MENSYVLNATSCGRCLLRIAFILLNPSNDSMRLLLLLLRLSSLKFPHVKLLVSTQVRSTWTQNPDHASHRGCCFPRAWVPEGQFASHKDLGPGTIRSTVFSLIPHLLLAATGILQPLIWLSSVSEISICRGSLGAQTVTSNWEVKCWWVKFTIVSTLLFISFPFTKMESQLLETFGEEVEPWDASGGKAQANTNNTESSWTAAALIY